MATLGGCGIWAVADWFAVIVNALESETEIRFVGLEAKFETTGLKTARTLAVISVTLTSAGCFLVCFLSIFTAIGSIFFKRKYASLQEREMSAPEDLFAEDDTLRMSHIG